MLQLMTVAVCYPVDPAALHLALLLAWTLKEARMPNAPWCYYAVCTPSCCVRSLQRNGSNSGHTFNASGDVLSQSAGPATTGVRRRSGVAGM